MQADGVIGRNPEQAAGLILNNLPSEFQSERVYPTSPEQCLVPLSG